jgi:RNA polymerase sigma-70 factor (ECF subfamily)
MLKTLGPQDRAAVVLRYWYDFSEEEIASALSLTVSAVKSRLHRSRRELAQLWLERQPGANEIRRALPDRRHYESPVF